MIFLGSRFSGFQYNNDVSGDSRLKFFGPDTVPFLKGVAAVADISRNPGFNGSASTVGKATSELGPAVDNVDYLNNSRNVSLSSSGMLPTPFFYYFTNDPPPVVNAEAALVTDLGSGETYFSFNSDKRWPLASLTKLMTAVVATENLDSKSRLTLSAADFANAEENEFFKAGYVYSVNDVISTMLLLSKNEAAQALADNYGLDKFVSLMNEKSRELGMSSTHYEGPTGLSVVNQSTAEDIKKLAIFIERNEPKIFELTRRKVGLITELNSGRKTTIGNINIFAGQSDFLGGKTGYTDEASGNLVSVFSYERRPILIVVLGTANRFGETERIFEWFKNNFRRTANR